MVFVPGGTFKMGRDDGDEYERSAHEVPVARDASRPPQGPRATPAPTHTPRVPRRGRSADGPRRAAPRFVIVTIVSNLPGCEVAIDDELEERETDERGRLAIPMEPGLYDVRITKSGYVTDGREIEVKSSPSGYHQEESFTLRRALLNLKVNTNPTGVRVSLDGEPEVESDANGSLTFEKVDPSVRHTLRGAKENYAEETVEVPPYKMEATVRLNRDLLTLKVKTYPSQADVYLDDVLKGTSDADGVLSIEKVKVGREHSLRAIKAGYVTQSVPVPPDYELAVIKLPSATDSSTPAAVQPTPEAQSDQSGSRQSPDNKEAGRAAGTSPPDPDAARQGNITPPPATEATPVLGPLTGAQDRASVSPLDVELKFWDSIKDRDNPDELAVYIKKYPDGQFIDLARIRLKAALAKKEAETGSGAAPPAPTPEEPKPVLGDAAMTIRASADGKFLLVELTGKSGDASATTGVVEVTVTMKGDTQLVSGKLPGYPCRVALARLENVAEYAFGEVPGAGNQWGHVVVRVRPKDPKRSMHFLINWTALDSGQAGNTLGVVDSADGGATAATTSTPALTLRKVTPRYPTSARLSRAEGVVTVALEINERGDVVSAKATNGPASLREAAEDAARQWKFAPARQNNRPVKSTLSVQFSFRL
jgi:TonB family protein